MKSRIILLALFLISITGKIEWGGRELMCPPTRMSFYVI